MKDKTQELLYLLMWAADRFSRPTLANWTDSYEGWAYRNGLLRQATVLERQRLLERDPTRPNDRIYRLTEQGRIQALGGRDPEAQWGRGWDRRWRLVVFDLPGGQSARRQRLWRYLRERGFGYLQKSVWITPDHLENEREILAGGQIEVGSLILLEARPCGEESDAQIVTGAWDFELINSRYSACLKVLDQRPPGALKDESVAKAFRHWTGQERAAWWAAVSIDPLLPQQLWPTDYLGARVWRKRVEVLREAGRQMRTFCG